MRTTALCSLLLAGTLGAQTASYAFPKDMAPGCLDSMQEWVSFRVLGAPHLGGGMLVATGPPRLAICSWTVWTGMLVTGTRLPAPVDMAKLSDRSFEWCGHLRIWPLMLDRFGSTPLQFRIPNDRRLLGLTFFQQIWGIGVSPCLGPRTFLHLSRAGRGVIGW